MPEPAVARRFAAQIDYVDHYTDDAAARFLRFRDTRVAVLGDDQLARWAALSLVRNGCAGVGVLAALDTPANRFAELAAEAEELRTAGLPCRAASVLQPGPEPGVFGWDDLDGYDVVLVTGDQGPRQVAALAAGIPAGRRLVPAWTFGGSVVIGPLLTADAAGCWTCAALRLGANGDPAHAADLWSRLAPNGPRGAAGSGAGEVRGPLAAMVGNLLGYEVFRLTTGALAAETDGQLIIQDLDSLDTVPSRCCRTRSAPPAARPRPPTTRPPTSRCSASRRTRPPTAPPPRGPRRRPPRPRRTSRSRTTRRRPRSPRSPTAPCWSAPRPGSSRRSTTRRGRRPR